MFSRDRQLPIKIAFKSDRDSAAIVNGQIEGFEFLKSIDNLHFSNFYDKRTFIKSSVLIYNEFRSTTNSSNSEYPIDNSFFLRLRFVCAFLDILEIAEFAGCFDFDVSNFTFARFSKYAVSYHLRRLAFITVLRDNDKGAIKITFLNRCQTRLSTRCI